MTIPQYIQGKNAELSVLDTILSVGIKNNAILCQRGIKDEPSDTNFIKIPDFSLGDILIEVKSISENIKNFKQANKSLLGSLLSEYLQYKTYFENRKRSRNNKVVYYVLVGSCDKDFLIRSLSEFSSWYWMKDRFKVIYHEELSDILKSI